MTSRPLAFLALAVLAATALAGCSSGTFDPAAEVTPTGKTVHLAMKVVDLFDQEVYPGLKANLWAFCVTPFDEGDSYSAAAIGYYTPLETDAPHLDAKDRATCSVPAPTITVEQGDRVIVEFSHTHFHPHTIHWHGQYVPAEMDGVPGISQQAVGGAGGVPSITYEFIAKRAGTLWYHCHVDTHLHVMQGLYGMFIVKPQSKKYEPKADAEAIMVLSTMARNVVEAIPGVNPHAHPAGCFTSGKPDCQNPPIDSGDADVFLINGHSYPLTEHQEQSIYHVDTGTTLRLRMLNAGETVEEVHLHGHDMQVVAIDGNPLPASARYYVDTVSIGPAQRFDVLIEGNNPGLWAFHTHVNAHEANDQQVPGGMHTMLIDGPRPADLHPFPVELPGGQPYQARVYLPGDFSNSTAFQMGATLASPVPGTAPAPAPFDATWTFPVELACAVNTIEVDARLTGGNAATDQLAHLDVSVLAPDGQPAAGFEPNHFTLGPAAPGESAVRQGHASVNFTNAKDLQQGAYKVTVSGQGAASTLALGVRVNYYASFDEVRFMHRLHKIPLCGTYGAGSNGIEVKAPPP
jgi:FtsP/CotA-like multicopper oxidase with cupredoxin domain